jgi:hypothetical protein
MFVIRFVAGAYCPLESEGISKGFKNKNNTYTTYCENK